MAEGRCRLKSQRSRLLDCDWQHEHCKPVQAYLLLNICRPLHPHNQNQLFEANQLQIAMLLFESRLVEMRYYQISLSPLESSLLELFGSPTHQEVDLDTYHEFQKVRGLVRLMLS